MSKKFTTSSTTKFLIPPCQQSDHHTYQKYFHGPAHWYLETPVIIWLYTFIFGFCQICTSYSYTSFYYLEIFCCICVSFSANSNSLNLLCLSEFAVCDIFFWSRNEFQNEFWNWTYRLLTWDASSRPDFASQASTWACTRGFLSCCVNAECPHLDWHDSGELNIFLGYK